MKDTEIRSITLRFIDPETSRRFDTLCRQRFGLDVCHQQELINGLVSGYDKATVFVQNATEKRKIISAWATESIYDPDKHQARLPLRFRS